MSFAHLKVDLPEDTKRKSYGPLLNDGLGQLAFIVLQWIHVDNASEAYFPVNENAKGEHYLDEFISGYLDENGHFLKRGHRDMYKAILFFDEETLAKFLKTKELNEYIIFDIKKGTKTLSR